MMENNPYQAYTEGSIFNDHPMRLVVSLYQGALDATRQASQCLQARDVWGRGKAINKVVAILSELMASLNEKEGAEIAQNLKRLYHYMQRRLIEAHARQVAEPLFEVEKLLAIMLEAWREACEKTSGSCEATDQGATNPAIHSEEAPYAAYLGSGGEATEPISSVFSF